MNAPMPCRCLKIPWAKPGTSVHMEVQRHKDSCVRSQLQALAQRRTNTVRASAAGARKGRGEEKAEGAPHPQHGQLHVSPPSPKQS